MHLGHLAELATLPTCEQMAAKANSKHVLDTGLPSAVRLPIEVIPSTFVDLCSTDAQTGTKGRRNVGS